MAEKTIKIPPVGRAQDTEKLHWVVQVQYRMRAVSFAAAFVGLCVQFWDEDYSVVAWVLLALQFLVYPHLVLLRARRAPVPLQAELQNLLVDSFLFGLWTGALGFPIWIALTLYISAALNNTISLGWIGTMRATILFVGGALIAGAFNGFHLAIQTEPVTVIMCVIGLSTYVLTIGHISFSRNRRLRETTERLRHGEKALMAANEALQERLDEIDQLQQKLGELVNLDPLTGLYNRRYLNSTLDRELARCARENQPLSLMMIDIDHFKKVNDTYGHQAGDEVLAQLGALLCENARTEDIACRYGGEEFLLLLPKMPLAVAQKRAEDLRVAFGRMEIQAGDRVIRTTLSIGISGYPQHGLSPDILVRRADIALYSAKSQGRDQVVMFADDAMVSGG